MDVDNFPLFAILYLSLRTSVYVSLLKPSIFLLYLVYQPHSISVLLLSGKWILFILCDLLLRDVDKLQLDML